MTTDGTAQPPAATSLDNRVLRDPLSLRALTHPVRISLLEALAAHGTLTATTSGDLLGETATTCSFHLRQLAKYGFVEEAGRGPGRERHWKLVDTPISATSEEGNPETADAVSALGTMLLDRGVARFRQWLATRAQDPDEWRRATVFHSVVVPLSAEEVQELGAEISELVARYAARGSHDPDPAFRPVELLLFAHPLAETAGDPDRLS